MSTVIDYSNWRPPSPAAVKAAGVEGVMRYIAPASWGWPKALTPGELAALEAAGLRVGFNFEAGVGDYRGDASKGMAQGTAAAQAMTELGLGREVPVFLSIDTDVPLSDFGLAMRYIAGFFSTCQHVAGLYAEGALIELAATAGVVKYGWESESTSFPGSGSLTPHSVLRQVYGQQVPGLSGAYDVNEVHAADWGFHPRPAAPSVSVVVGATGTQQLQGDEVKLTSYSFRSDAQGRGWLLTVPWETFVAATVQGSYPPDDGYWRNPRVAVQNRGGKACVALQECAPNSNVTFFVAHTA